MRSGPQHHWGYMGILSGCTWSIEYSSRGRGRFRVGMRRFRFRPGLVGFEFEGRFTAAFFVIKSAR